MRRFLAGFHVALTFVQMESKPLKCSDVCEPWKLGDGFCDTQCNIPVCDFDFGDCIPCAEGCEHWKIGDSICHPNCNHKQCGFDGGDCLRSNSCTEAVALCTGGIENTDDPDSLPCGSMWREAAAACGNATHPSYLQLHRGFSRASQCFTYYALNIDQRYERAFLLYHHALRLCTSELDVDLSHQDLLSDSKGLVQTAFIDGHHTFNGGGPFHLEFQYTHDYLSYWQQAQQQTDALPFCAESDRAQQCVTPFIYGERSYTGCTDMSDGYRPWCALMVDNDGHCSGDCAEKGVEWDYCASCAGDTQNASQPLVLHAGSGFLSFQFDHRPPLVEEGLPLSYDIKLLGCDVGTMTEFIAAYDRFLSLECWDMAAGAIFPCSGECFSAYCDFAELFVEGPPHNCGWDDVCQIAHHNGTFVKTFCRFFDRETPTSLGSYLDQCSANSIVDGGKGGEISSSITAVCPSGLSAESIDNLIPLRGATIATYRLSITGTSLSIHTKLSIGLGKGLILEGTVVNAVGGIEGELAGEGKSFVTVRTGAATESAEVTFARRESGLLLLGSRYVMVPATPTDFDFDEMERSSVNGKSALRRQQEAEEEIDNTFLNAPSLEEDETQCVVLCLHTLHCVGYTFYVDVLGDLGQHCWLLVERTASPTATPTSYPSATPTQSPTTSSCMDGILNGDETAIDCGGSCGKCTVGQRCEVDADCNNSLCTVLENGGELVCTTFSPTVLPTKQPTSASPTHAPTMVPTITPTMVPTITPTASPTRTPSVGPSYFPTAGPTKSPTPHPTAVPTKSPTIAPSSLPTALPTHAPTWPTFAPTTNSPTFVPSLSPTNPTAAPTSAPIPPCTLETLASLDFFGSRLEYSNLDGVGPDFSYPEAVFYSSVGKVGGESFDLKVQLASGTFAATKFGEPDADFSSYIGLSGKFGQLINTPAGVNGTTTHYNFAFEKNGIPLSLNYFHFSFFDLDRGNGIQEEWCVNNDQITSWSTGQGELAPTDDMNVTMQPIACDGSAGSSTVFVALKHGDGDDNPSDPLQLGIVVDDDGNEIDQRDRSVAFFFRGTSNFDFTWTTRCIDTDQSCASVRGLNFAGESTITNGCDTSSPTTAPSHSMEDENGFFFGRRRKISDVYGNFGERVEGGLLRDNANFGRSVAVLGDVDNDGVQDLVVGANTHQQVSALNSVWVLFLNRDASVKDYKQLMHDEATRFGTSVCALGDLDGDSVPDMAIGAPNGPENSGDVWIYFLNADGSPKVVQKIDEFDGGFTGWLGANSEFGKSLVVASRRNEASNTKLTLAVGSGDRKVFLLFLNGAGTVNSYSSINSPNKETGNFGFSVGAVGDVNRDGIADIAVGDPLHGNGGAIFIVFLDSAEMELSHTEISQEIGFGEDVTWDENSRFGSSVAGAGDLDGDGVFDVAVGAAGFWSSANFPGEMWVIFLTTLGTVKSYHRFGGESWAIDLDTADLFGTSASFFQDLNGDGTPDLAIGAAYDDDGGPSRGAVWIVLLTAVQGSGTICGLDPSELCNCAGTIYYGRRYAVGNSGEIATLSQMLSDDHALRYVHGQIACSHESFDGEGGNSLLPGVLKQCYCVEDNYSPTPSPVSGYTTCEASPHVSCGATDGSSLELLISEPNYDSLTICVAELCESDREAGGSFNGDSSSTIDQPTEAEFQKVGSRCETSHMDLQWIFDGHLSGDLCWYQVRMQASNRNSTSCISDYVYQQCAVDAFTSPPTAQSNEIVETPSPTWSLCFDGCEGFNNDGDCDDGGVGSNFDVCEFGQDCGDCGTRYEGESPNDPNIICEDTCQYVRDDFCDDGGEGSVYDSCARGTDCSDCGIRYVTTASPTLDSAQGPSGNRKKKRMAQEVSASTVLDSTRWVLSMRDSFCNWDSFGSTASIRLDMISECLDMCDLEPSCSGWVLWNSAQSTCILQKTPCERWSSPGAHPGWEIWHDRSRAEGWVTEGALGFSSAVNVVNVDLFGDWRGNGDSVLDFVSPGCPKGLIEEISLDCKARCPQNFGTNYSIVTNEENFHCLCAQCDLSFLLDLCGQSPQCAGLEVCHNATALYSSLSSNYTCDNFAVTRNPCSRHWIGNGFCDEGCNSVEYDYDEGDCLQCAPGCQQHYIGDQICDEQCNTRLCNFDGGDCGGSDECSPGCSDSYLGDNFCDANCNTEECNFDDGDCLTRCAVGCENAFLGDSFCDKSCNVFECNFDLGDCNECSDGCPFSWLADGVCDAPCQNEACSYDFGDCGVVIIENGTSIPPEEGNIVNEQCSNIYFKLTRLTLRIGNMQLQENYLANAISEVEAQLAALEIERAELEMQRDELAELYAELDAEFLRLQIEKAELERLSWALGNQTNLLESQRAVLEEERNALQLERDALEAETVVLEGDKEELEYEQEQLEIAKKAVEVERDDYLTRWLASAALFAMIFQILLVSGYFIYKGRKKRKDAYSDFKKNLLIEENEPGDMESDVDLEEEDRGSLEANPALESTNEGGQPHKSVSFARLGGQNRVVPTAVEVEAFKTMDSPSPIIEVEETISTAREDDDTSKKGEIDFDPNSQNGYPEYDMFPHNWKKGRGKLPGCDTDEIEELLQYFADEDTLEGQREGKAKLVDVQAKIDVETEMEKEVKEIEEALSNENTELAVKLDEAISDGNIHAQSEIFETVKVDLDMLRQAHANEMEELQKQLSNSNAANDELLALRLKRRRAQREKALRETGANEEQVKVVMRDFEDREKAALEHDSATQDAVRAKVLSVAKPPDDCFSDATVLQSEAELRKQFKTDKSTLEDLKNNERGRLEEILQKKLILRQKKRRAELERKALEEKEARLQKEILAEKHNYDHHGNKKPKLERIDSMREMQTLEDLVMQHEEEVKKLESMVMQQSARQNERLEERLLRRKQGRQRQLKQAKVSKKEIKKEIKKVKKLDEAERKEADAISQAMNRELLQTSQMVGEAPEVATAQEFKQLLEEARNPEINTAVGKELAAVGKHSVDPLRQSRITTGNVEWELNALEQAKQQAVELEKKRQEALFATKKEHEKDILFLETQLKEELELKESQLRARLAKRQAKNFKKSEISLRGPALQSPGNKGGLVLEPLSMANKMQADAKQAEMEFEQEIAKLKAEFSRKRQSIMDGQRERLEEDAKMAKLNVEAEAAETVEKAKRQQAILVSELENIKNNHKVETSHLQAELDAQQKRVDARLQARLAERKKAHAFQHSQPDAARLNSGPIRDSWTIGMEEETDPEIIKMRQQLEEKKLKLKIKIDEQLEKEREQKRKVQAAHAEALVFASAFNTFKDKLHKDERRQLVRQNSSGKSLVGSDPKTNEIPLIQIQETNGKGVDINTVLSSDDSAKKMISKPKLLSRTNSTDIPSQGRPMEPKTIRAVLKLLVKFEQHKFTEDECLVLEEFARVARKNVGKKSTHAPIGLDAIRDEHEKQTGKLQEDLKNQQKREDERLQARLAKRKKSKK